MATQVQFRRGTTAEHSGFKGADGEVTVDTTLKTVVVHDAITNGDLIKCREFIEKGADLNVLHSVAYKVLTPLHHAASMVISRFVNC